MLMLMMPLPRIPPFVIDGETVLTGSFNFTKAAQAKNAENLLGSNPNSRRTYTENGEAHRQHSQPYVGRGGAVTGPCRTRRGWHTRRLIPVLALVCRRRPHGNVAVGHLIIHEMASDATDDEVRPGF